MCENEITELEIVKRRSLIIYVYSLKQINNLKKFGVLNYVSKKMKYVVLYINDYDVERIIPLIEKLHFVRSVDKSYRPDVEMNFADKIGNRPPIIKPIEDDGFEVAEANTRIVLAEDIQ